MNAHFEHPCCGKVEGSPDCGSYEHHAGVVEVWEQDPTQSDTLARAQAKAAEHYDTDESEYSPPRDPVNMGFGETHTFTDPRRCLFGHSVPANQGYSTKAGWICYSHSAEFDHAGN